MSIISKAVNSLFKKEANRDHPLEEDMKLKNYFDTYEVRNKVAIGAGPLTTLPGFIFQNSYFNVHVSPTANCQTCSVAGIQHMFSYPNYIHSFLKEINRVTVKKLIIVEIREEYMTYVDEMIDPDFIVMKNPYKSTNGNPMVLMMWNISSLIK